MEMELNIRGRVVAVELIPLIPNANHLTQSTWPGDTDKLPLQQDKFYCFSTMRELETDNPAFKCGWHNNTLYHPNLDHVWHNGREMSQATPRMVSIESVSLHQIALVVGVLSPTGTVRTQVYAVEVDGSDFYHYWSETK